MFLCYVSQEFCWEAHRWLSDGDVGYNWSIFGTLSLVGVGSAPESTTVCGELSAIAVKANHIGIGVVRSCKARACGSARVSVNPNKPSAIGCLDPSGGSIASRVRSPHLIDHILGCVV